MLNAEFVYHQNRVTFVRVKYFEINLHRFNLHTKNVQGRLDNLRDKPKLTKFRHKHVHVQEVVVQISFNLADQNFASV